MTRRLCRRFARFASARVGRTASAGTARCGLNTRGSGVARAGARALRAGVREVMQDFLGYCRSVRRVNKLGLKQGPCAPVACEDSTSFGQMPALRRALPTLGVSCEQLLRVNAHAPPVCSVEAAPHALRVRGLALG